MPWPVTPLDAALTSATPANPSPGFHTLLNAERDAINALLAILGTDPQGNAVDVTARLQALDALVAAKVNAALMGVANGLATLDSNSKIVSGQLPAIALTDTYVVGSQAAMLALPASHGSVAVRTDPADQGGQASYILSGSDPTQLANWTKLLTPPDAISSIVFGGTGHTGVVTIPEDAAASIASLRSLGAGAGQAAAGADLAAEITNRANADSAEASARAAGDAALLPLAGGVLTGPLGLTQLSTPAAPGAGITDLYRKTDGRLYRLTPDGLEKALADAWAFDVSAYGAKGDTVALSDLTTTNASPNVSSPSALWVAGDVGKSFVGENIPAGTTISSVTDATHVVLSANASASKAGAARAIYFTDDTAAINAAFAAVLALPASVPATVLFPGRHGCTGLLTALDDRHNVTLLGRGGRANGPRTVLGGGYSLGLPTSCVIYAGAGVTTTPADAVTTNNSQTITSAGSAWTAAAVVGRPIWHSNVPQGASVSGVASGTSLTSDRAASGNGSGQSISIGNAFISARRTRRFTIDQLGVFYASSSFKGVLVDVGAQSSATGGSDPSFRRCSVGALWNGMAAGNGWGIFIGRQHYAYFEKVEFWGCDVQVVGCSDGSFHNNTTMTGCTHHAYGTVAFRNPSEATLLLGSGCETNDANNAFWFVDQTNWSNGGTTVEGGGAYSTFFTDTGAPSASSWFTLGGQNQSGGFIIDGTRGYAGGSIPSTNNLVKLVANNLAGLTVRGGTWLSGAVLDFNGTTGHQRIWLDTTPMNGHTDPLYRGTPSGLVTYAALGSANVFTLEQRLQKGLLLDTASHPTTVNTVSGMAVVKPAADTDDGITVKRPSATWGVGTKYGQGQALTVLNESGDPPGVTAMGAWAAPTTYAKYAQVTSGGLTYNSLADGNLGNDPATNPTLWQEVPTSYQAVVDRGAHNMATNYAKWERVTVADGTPYASTRPNNLGHDPATSPDWWFPVRFPGSLLSRLSPDGGAGFSAPVHIAVGLRQKGAATVYPNLWLQRSVDVAGIVIENPGVPAVPGTPVGSYLTCTDVRVNPSFTLADLVADGTLNLYKGLIVQGRAVTDVPFKLQRIASQSADFMQVLRTDATKAMSIIGGTGVGAGGVATWAANGTTLGAVLYADDTTPLGARAYLQSVNAATVGLVVNGASGQTADIAQFLLNAAIKTRINKGGYFMTRVTAAPADGDVATSELAVWFDNTVGAAKAMFKGKNSAGTVVTGSVSLT